MNLKNQLNIKNNEIQELKLKIQNNYIKDEPKYNKNQMMVINFISQDSTVTEGIICLPSDVFVEVEKVVYQQRSSRRGR